jgi:hypothetical protein
VPHVSQFSLPRNHWIRIHIPADRDRCCSVESSVFYLASATPNDHQVKRYQEGGVQRAAASRELGNWPKRRLSARSSSSAHPTCGQSPSGQFHAASSRSDSAERAPRTRHVVPPPQRRGGASENCGELYPQTVISSMGNFVRTSAPVGVAMSISSNRTPQSKSLPCWVSRAKDMPSSMVIGLSSE